MSIIYDENKFNRPTLHGILINGKRGRLLATLYLAGGVGIHPTVLLLHGLPGNEQNEDIAQALRQNGFHVLAFHYSGCFGSDGDYSLLNNIEDANTALDYILKDTSFGFDKKRIFAVGHSMGGFVCGQIAALREEIKGAVLLMPCDIGRIWQIKLEDPAEHENIKNLLSDSAAWLTGSSKESFLSELADHSEEFRLESLADSLSKKPVLCIEGALDIHTPPCYHCLPLKNAVSKINGQNFKSISIETDHFASDCRLQITENVVKFLTELLKKSQHE